jgi:hypothetical protein
VIAQYTQVAIVFWVVGYDGATLTVVMILLPNML